MCLNGVRIAVRAGLAVAATAAVVACGAEAQGVRAVRPAAAAAPYVGGALDDPGTPVVLFVHGGGWLYGGAAMTHNRTVRRWRREGVAIWSTNYRPGAASLGDVARAYATVRRRVGPRRRVCLHGESSGGQLALMVAARASSVDCVISDSGVVDLAAVPRTSGLRPIIDGWLLADGGMRRWDPLTNARRIRQPVLLVHHREDPVVSPDQSRRLAAALARAAFVELPPGPRTGPVSYHGRHTTAAADRRAWRAAVRLVREGRLPGEPAATVRTRR